MGLGIPSMGRTSKCASHDATQSAANPRPPAPPAAKPPNPDPKNFAIMRSYGAGKWCVVEVRYPDATNYEGRKVMVYAAPASEVLGQAVLDPHFCDNDSCLSPFARFEPTDRGWRTALALVESMSR
jgi:hypothetical protein